MSEYRQIQWPRAKYWDKPWNPMLGCVPASPACKNCYARTSSERFCVSFEPHETSKENPPRSGVVFCGNMTDLFGEWVGIDDSMEYVVRSLGRYGKATYLWLTKRPERMCYALRTGWMIPSDDADAILSFDECEFGNQYFGFTAENQEWYDRRKRAFCQGASGKPRWANGWLSAEPLLEPINLRFYKEDPMTIPFKWVVVGCESGGNRRPCKIEWVESIVEQCKAVGVPVFVKQLDINGKCETDIEKFPEHLRIRQVPWVCENGAEEA